MVEPIAGETELTTEEAELIERLIVLFHQKAPKIQSLLDQVKAMIEPEMQEGGRLFGLIHSTKGRIKDTEHLRKKLARKIKEGKQKQEPYGVTEENFFHKVTDLAAYRIMHLHPCQMEKIHPFLLELMEERKLPLWEPPEARIWDMEIEKFYRERVKLKTKTSADKLYTSVHYVVLSNWTTKFTCEIQVRTLADEVWGEVDHKINYPVPLESIACTEQIKSLAHLTTSCNRLVDSIFASHVEWDTLQALAKAKPPSSSAG